jgi:hypothetical protein
MNKNQNTISGVAVRDTAIFTCPSKSVTWYGEPIVCRKLTDHTQHYSEWNCLFENARMALLIKPDVTQLSILSAAVPNTAIFTCPSKGVTRYGESIACRKLTDDTQQYSEQDCLFEIARTALVKPEVTEFSILSVAVPQSRIKLQLRHCHSRGVHSNNVSAGWYILARGDWNLMTKPWIHQVIGPPRLITEFNTTRYEFKYVWSVCLRKTSFTWRPKANYQILGYPELPSGQCLKRKNPQFSIIFEI